MSLTPRVSRHLVATAKHLGLLAIIGCSGTLDLPPGEPTAYLQAVFQPGDAVQSVWVELGSSSDSTFSPTIRPVDPALVSLTFVEPDGTRTPLLPAPSDPGRFDANATVQPGALYAVEGTIDGRQVRGETVLPGPLVMTSPATDTIRLQGVLSTTIPFHWSAAGASVFVSEFRGGGQSVLSATRDTVGQLRIFRVRDTMELLVRAYDPNTSGFLFSETPVNRLLGGFGFVGGASQDKRFVIVWE